MDAPIKKTLFKIRAVVDSENSFTLEKYKIKWNLITYFYPKDIIVLKPAEGL